MSSGALLYILYRIAQRKNPNPQNAEITIRELFDTLYDLWVNRGYALFSDHSQVQDMLDLLQELGFIEIIKGTQIRLTEKGSAECRNLPKLIMEDVPMV
jgi:hypothetical protein